MPPLTQENRLLGIRTTLGPDVLLLTSFSGHEEISRLFNFQLEMLSEEDSIAAKDILGKRVTFHVLQADGEPRHFNGFVNRFSAGSREGGLRRYEAEVVPWLWFLTRTADCRIFQEKSIPQIIEKIFSDLGFSDYETSEIKGTHEPWEYCVQYRETDFNFVARLMEQEGIFYYFRHEDDKHTLVLADQKGAYKDCPENEVEYEGSYGSRPTADRITQWEHKYEFTPGKWSQTDYNFIDHPARGETTPSKLLMTGEATVVDLDNIDKYEIYDYPGEYPDKDRGRTYTKIRIEEEEVAHDTVEASSTCRTFTPGGKFKITRHDCEAEQGKTFAITSIEHTATEPATYESTGGQGEEYSNSFRCIPDSVTFRPARITPKPVVQGSQTAVVTGPAGEDIWPDEYGRVKIQFFWDREGKRDENTSCWVRVSQNWGGQGWGGMFIPHVGQEVIVSFIEGDPDRPIITGRVYNADQTVPLDLPANKTKSIIRDHGGNEIVMEGADGKQQMKLHSPTEATTMTLGDGCIDMTTSGNQDTSIGGNRVDVVSGDTREQTEGSLTRFIFGDELKQTDGKLEWKLGGTLNSITMGAETSQNLSAKSSTVVGVHHSTFVGAKIEVNASVHTSRTYGLKWSQHGATERKKSVTKDEEATARYSLKSPAIVIDAGTIFTAEGGSSSIDVTSGDIVLDCGGSTITLAKGGVVTIKCSTVKFKCNAINFGGAYLSNGKNAGLF